MFNLSISLAENPQGDDDYTADPGASDDAQNKFEKKIEEFADAVFQMTNGAHKIGKVTIFRDGDQANNADVQWIENCPSNAGPRANPSGFGVAGKRIYFCTNWPGAPTLMDTPKGAGFTLAHEWGHYTYGVYDEYASNCGQNPETDCVIWLPRSTDTVSSPSIMNNQWNAARTGGDQDWLEFSTEGVQPYSADADGDNKNAHARVFGESGWKTLTRSPSTDPRHSFLPTRTQYTNLTAPTSADWTVNDDESTARSELKIVWAGNQVVELMIDTSGSMSVPNGTPMANAKTAADLLVGQLTPGSTAVGVGRFTGSASQVYAITDIPDPDTGVRAAAQAAIASLSAGGSTNIQAAALLALSETQAFESGSRPSVVFLLTDGISSVNVSTVTSAYTSAGVPLMTFGFGPSVDTALLQSLASGTGGQYFFSPTSLAAIQQAFVAANAAVSSSVVVSSGTAASVGGSTEVRSVQLDSTMETAVINATYALSEADISLRLLDALGSDTGLMFSCVATSEVSCTLEVDVVAMGAGEYGIEIVNNTGSDKDVSVLVSGAPSVYENYDLAVEFNNANYPESFAIYATVTKGAALAGLDVTAVVTKPDATTMNLTLLDDGKNADLIADDGVYSVDVPYGATGNGTYTAVVSASNDAGQAETTYNNVAVSVRPDGSGVIPTRTSITEKFTRAAVASAIVAGALADDHADDPATPGACTTIFDDNIDTLGRIDVAADVDCFVFTPSATTDDLVVRVTSLRLNMEPVVRIYDPTGTTQQLTADLASSENAASGVVVTIPAISLDPLGHVVTVEHADNTADSGGYAVSVGRSLTSDVKAAAPPPPAPKSGAMGPWSLLLGMVLALLGLIQRRRMHA